jgi:L-ascorbate metabolism protein UlaG (beta-lactamase superfamily)
MQIQYLGHSSFKLRGGVATVVTDPYSKGVGWTFNKTAADIVTVSHDHDDHNAIDRVEGTSRRKEPYVVTAPGEYEISEVGIFGWGSFHDDKEGEERGKNTIYNIHVDNVRVAHLGDLGHTLSDELVEYIGAVDVLLVPVGGVYTINAEQAVDLVNQLQPAIVIPMHYKTERHNPKIFSDLDGVDLFVKEMGGEGIEMQEKLTVTTNDLPEETTIVILSDK